MQIGTQFSTRISKGIKGEEKMKKRILAICLVLLIICLGGCNSKKSNENEDKENNTKVEEEVTKNETEEQPSKDEPIEESSNLNGVFNVPMHSIYVNVPTTGFQELEKGFTQLYIEHDVKFVAITAVQTSGATEVQEAHDISLERLIMNVNNYCHINSINIETSSTENINGVETFFFEGMIDCKEYSNSYAIGYSFIYDEVPCNIIGVVMDPSQNEEFKTEISTMVKEMMQSVRSEQ